MKKLLAVVVFMAMFAVNAFSEFNDSLSAYNMDRCYTPKTVTTKIAAGASTTLDGVDTVVILDSTWKPSGAEFGLFKSSKGEAGLYALTVPAFDSATGDTAIGYLPKVFAYASDGALLGSYTGDTISNAGAQVVLPINTGELAGIAYKVILVGIATNCGPHTFKGPYIHKLVPAKPE